MRTRLAETVHRCGVHNLDSTLAWNQLAAVCSCVTVICVTEPDGFHQHEIRFGDDAYSRAILVEHLHVWMDGTTAFTFHRGKRETYDVPTLADGWAAGCAVVQLRGATLPDSAPCTAV